ncbi:MAG: 6-phosphogluconolactonase [Acidimicrobiia bacterium]
MRVTVFPDPGALAAGAAEVVAELLLPPGPVTFGVAGGTTPQATYRHLRDARVEWERVDAWLSDERWVPLDHPDSNGRMAEEALLGHVPARFHRPRWAPWLTADRSAAQYEHDLLEILVRDGRPRPDLVLLGMGDDGHTASLFPGTEALEVRDRWFVANWAPAQGAWRLSATYPLLHAARHLVVLVSGEGKAEALARVLEGDGDPLPARRVMDGSAEVLWLVDEAAAAGLQAAPVERP